MSSELFLLLYTGPTLLFTLTNSADESVKEKFYACAVCRSRKECNFYQPYSRKETQEKRELRLEIYEQHNESNKRFAYQLDG